MSFKLLGGGSDLPNIVNDVNQNILELKGREVTEIFKDETGTRRVLIGKGPNGFYGLKVSSPGYDVFETADANLVFNSDQNVFKVVLSGSIPLPQVGMPDPGAGTYAEGQSTLVSGVHGLGFTPAVIAYIEFSSGLRAAMPYTAHTVSGATASWQTYTPIVSATNFRIDVRYIVYGGPASSFSTATVKYYLLQETAD